MGGSSDYVLYMYMYLLLPITSYDVHLYQPCFVGVLSILCAYMNAVTGLMHAEGKSLQ